MMMMKRECAKFALIMMIKRAKVNCLVTLKNGTFLLALLIDLNDSHLIATFFDTIPLL